MYVTIVVVIIIITMIIIGGGGSNNNIPPPTTTKNNIVTLHTLTHTHTQVIVLTSSKAVISHIYCNSKPSLYRLHREKNCTAGIAFDLVQIKINLKSDISK
jgi:hypothetical protein